MPHIIVKLYPGRSEEKKRQLARRIVKDVLQIGGCEEKSISVAFEEVAPEDWAERVYRPDIINNRDKLMIKPGYNPFHEEADSEEDTRIGELHIRTYQAADERAVIDLWQRCNLVVPQNDPQKDIAMKGKVQADLFFVGVIDKLVIATVMAGYDGHRGWIYYLAVDPDYQRQGMGYRMMEKAESALRQRGCPKINLQVRNSNLGVIAFYKRLGFSDDDVIGLGKRL
jgi:ribosomal protein S18 acetylase RimI-like enzyme